MAWFIVLAALALFLTDGLSLIRHKKWADFTTFIFLIAAACILFFARNAGMPSPLNFLNNLCEGLGKKLFG